MDESFSNGVCEGYETSVFGGLDLHEHRCEDEESVGGQKTSEMRLASEQCPRTES